MLSPEGHDPYAAIRSPNYRLYAAGFGLAATGLRMLSVAILWEIYERTHSEWHLGLTGLARAAPVVLLALPGGHLADVVSRKWILLFTQLAFAACASGMALWSFHHGPLWVGYSLMTLMGCARAFNGPARGALLPLLVEKDDFHNAVTWTTGIFHISGCVGPLIAGAMIHQKGAAWPVYLVTAVTSAVFAVSATFLRPKRAQRLASRLTVRSMLSGLGYLRKERTVLGAILIDCFGVLLGGATALLPVYAKDILKVGPVGLGALNAAPFVGAAIMAVYLAHRPPFLRAGQAFLSSVALWGVAAILFGISPWFGLSLVVLALQGAIDNISVVIRHVLVQVRTPDELRGRVSAVNTMFIEVSNELGAFESGGVARLYRELMGSSAAAAAVFSVVSGGIGTLVVVGLVGRFIPELRELRQLKEPEPDEAGAAAGPAMPLTSGEPLPDQGPARSGERPLR